MNANPRPLLQLSDLRKRYGTVTVVDDVSLTIHAGQIHALLGANGAGKSTLVRMIAGLVSPSGGQMKFHSEPYAPGGKREAERSGVEIVQQELNLISTLSVAENLMLSRLPSAIGIIGQRQLHTRARAALDRFGIDDVATDTLVGCLGVGKQQMVEIAAALDRDCRLLILDEPTAALSAAESELLFQRLDALRSDGVAIIYISHRLDEVSRLADRISVLRDGKHVGTYPAEDCDTDRMVELMSGEETSRQSEYTGAAIRNDVLMRVKNISGGIVSDVSFEVRAGERLGISGLVGSGRTELLRLIFGADTAASGSVEMKRSPGRNRFRHPGQAVVAGLAMVTEDRKQTGLLLNQSIRSNTSLAAMWKRFSWAGLIRGAVERDVAGQQCESLEVRCNDIEQAVGTLSGGNQQKVAIAKWLVRDADVFLFDEPTRGIDVAARRRIYRLLDTLTQQGKATVMVSSDLDELLEVCDRVAVMSNGRLVETFARDNWSPQRMNQAAFSGYQDRGSVA